jgi:hypothetical protein
MPLLIFSFFTIRARMLPWETYLVRTSNSKVSFYCLTITALIFMLIGTSTPLFYLPAYAVSRGVTAWFATYLVVSVNVASLFGIRLPPILAPRIGRLDHLAAGGFAAGS